QLEAARLIVAPVLTIISGAGIFFLPTYTDQVKRRVPFQPAVGRAMLAIGSVTAAYGAIALIAREPLVRALTAGDVAVSSVAIASWILFVMFFGAGLPVGGATVALGHARRTFVLRSIDAGVGVGLAAAFAAAGWIEAVPAGLAVGALVGAVLLLRALRREPPWTDVERTGVDDERPNPLVEATALTAEASAPLAPAHWRWAGSTDDGPPAVPRTTASTRLDAPALPPIPVRTSRRTARRTRRRLVDRGELLWIVPLVLIVAVEYKLRRRDIDGALTGSIDPMIAAELGIVGLIGIWSLTRLIPSRPRIEPLMMLMWGYILTTAVSALYSIFPMLALARAVELIIIGTVIQLVSAEGTLSTISRFLHGWIALISLSIVAGLAYVAPTTGPQEGRFTWFSVHSVTAGSMFAASVPLLFGLWLTAGRQALPWPRWVYATLFAVHVVFLMLTRTRGSIGGAIVAVAVMAWLSSGRRARPELVLGSLVVGGGVALALGRPVLEFLTRGETVDQLGTFNRRTEIWSLAWDSFKENPIFGLGFNSAKGVFFDETGLGGAHNSVINVMIDVGLVGLAWWTALVVASLILLGRLRGIERRSQVLLPGATGTARSDELIILGVFVALLINSITTEGLGSGVNVMAIWLFVSAAWLTILDRDQRTRRAQLDDRSASRRELRREVRDRQPETVA
ncbi:MAG: O-antigen ligase family protein, partial [Ilumatobacteraceae bacterium]